MFSQTARTHFVFILEVSDGGWEWEYQTTWPASSETCMQLRKQQLELEQSVEQQTGSK